MVTDEKEIRLAFVNHFKQIYKKGTHVPLLNMYSSDLLGGLPQIPGLVTNQLIQLPTEEEAKWALFALRPHKPNKALGPQLIK